MRARDYRNCFVLDKELDFRLRDMAVQNNVTISAIARDALRWYFNLPHSTFDAGWREGYAAAYADVQEAVRRAVNTINPTITPPPLPPQGGPVR